jgi:hypothetical protein
MAAIFKLLRASAIERQRVIACEAAALSSAGEKSLCCDFDGGLEKRSEADASAPFGLGGLTRYTGLHTRRSWPWRMSRRRTSRQRRRSSRR